MGQLTMYWLPGNKIPNEPLPEGYSISTYKQESDKLDWCRICQNGLVGDKATAATFDNSITNNINIYLYNDVFFLDYKGEHIGTTTAFWHKTAPDHRGDMHMVSIRSDFRGKGLSKYLTQITIQHLKDVPGMKYIFLTTDDWRRPAVKGYLNGGFMPVNNEPFMVERWQAILNDPTFNMDELQLLNPDLSYGPLLKKGSNVGKIVAIGGGFAPNWEFVRNIVNLTGKRGGINYLVIPTTAYDTNLATLAMFAKYGCNCETLMLTHPYMTEEIAAQKISQADIIEVPGGNLQFCMNLWNKFNLPVHLRKAFETGTVMFGSSSGSMCWFSRGFDDCGPYDRFVYVDGAGLIPYCNVPHYESAFWQEFNSHASDAGMSVIACENETALCYIGGKYTILKSGARPDASVWFFDAANNYERLDLTKHPEILEKL